MAKASSVWKVFVPHDLMVQSDAHLFGHVEDNRQTVYITASSCDSSVTSQLPVELKLIGTWVKHSKNGIICAKPSKSEWIKLSTNQNAELVCFLFINKVQIQCTCIIYNPCMLLRSDILSERSEDPDTPWDNISSVVKVLKNTHQSLGGYETIARLQIYCGSLKQKETFSKKLLLYLLMLVTYLHLPFNWLRSGMRFSSKWKILNVPTTFAQLGSRANDLDTALLQNASPIKKLKSINKCVRQILDSLLGVCLMYYLMRGNRAQYIADVSLSYGDIIASEMKRLLHWLMGSPAGLKLNSQLTHFLANFFQYHIYLWTGYLYLLKPVLGQMVYYSSIVGVWGITVQLALFQDIFSTLTIHIYCFYVYAARLYQLQLYTLASLWRLFRGKKWNVLRQRVDSAVYDADQLFVGTLVFTVLLFLLPTTGLYYVVFTLLRLLVLMIQGMVGKLRCILNSLPVWSVWLWVIKSTSLIDGAVFEVLPSELNKNNITLVLTMQGTRVGLSEVFALTSDGVAKKTNYSWGSIVKNIFQGDLVYPWIQRHQQYLNN